MDIMAILTWIVANKDVLGLGIFAIMAMNGSARGAIAAVNEIMQAANLTDDQALQKASDLMGKYWPFLPDFVRKWIIQSVFDNIKKTASKDVAAKKK